MYIKIFRTGNITEIYRYAKTPNPPKKGTRRSSPRQRRSSFRSLANCKRSRQTFIRIVRSNLTGAKPVALLTLTMRDIVGIEVGYSCLTGFVSNLRRVFGNGFAYIAVPEFQKRGAVHFHILVWGLPSKIITDERRTRLLQNLWALGFVDCVETDGSPKLAGYLAKYMSKSMQDDRLAGKKAYVCSRNLLRPMSYNSDTLASLPADFWDGDTRLLTKISFPTQWMGECDYQLIESL